MSLTGIELEDAKYNARDVLSMCRVAPHLFNEIQRVGAEGVYGYDELMADLALQMTRIGMPVNVQRRQEIGKRLYALRDRAVVELRPFTEGEFRDAFLDWVATFFAKTVRTGEPTEGTIRLGPTRAAAELEEAQRQRAEWKAYRKELLDSEPEAALGPELANADSAFVECELHVKLAKKALQVAQFTPDIEEGLPHTAETAFAVRCAIRRQEAELAISKKGVNFGAKVQQAAILRAAGVPLHRVTEKTGLPKIDKEVLEQYSRHTAARALLSYILTQKTIDTYIEGEKRLGRKGNTKPVVVGEDGYLHPIWTVHKITGRWGSSPNCFDAQTELCVRENTEVAFAEWMSIARLVSEYAKPHGRRFKVAQYVPETGIVEWVDPIHPFRQNYTGHMVRFNHQYLDLLVTDDHRLFMCRDLAERGGLESKICFRVRASVDWCDPPAGQMLRGVVPGQLPCPERASHKLLAFVADSCSRLSPRLVDPLDVEISRMEWAGPVYCLSVPSSFVVVRRNGKICVSGQCQNWSKRAGGGAENLRSMIEAPEGYLLVGADQKQLEARLIGAMSGCRLMIDCFRKGDDIHSLFANIGFPDEWPRLAKIFKEHKAAAGGKCKCGECEQRNKMRDRTKNLEYGAFYGGQEQKLFEAIVKDFPEATLGQVREFLARFNAMLPEVLAWRQQTLTEAIKAGEIRSPILGRRQVFPLGRVEPNVAYNYKAQSGGADIWAIGAGKFMEKWNQWEFDARLIHNGHDSVLVLCREELAPQIEQDIYECWNLEWNGVPFEMECKIAKQWSET